MNKVLNPLTIKADGIGLNARHFAAMSESDAIKAMKEDHISDDETWARKTYALCVKAVKDDADLTEKLNAKETEGKKDVKQPPPTFLKPAAVVTGTDAKQK